MQDSKPPIKEKDIPANSDNKIDQDFPGFPNGESTEKLIHPKTEEEKKVAAVNIKDGEKVNKDETDEENSDGSGGAFDSTEDMQDDDNDSSHRDK